MNQIKKFNRNEGDNWVQKATYRRENKNWLAYSRKIALRILAAMEDIPKMTQKSLAESLDVSPQHINKIIKGQENLTLQTIAKFSEVLGVELIAFPSFKYNVGTIHVFVATDNKATLIQFERQEIELFSLHNNLPLFRNITSNPTAQTIIQI